MDKDIALAWKMCNTVWKKIACTHHQDKCFPDDKENKKAFREVCVHHDRHATGWDVRCTNDIDDNCNECFPKCIKYYQACKELQALFAGEFDKQYPGKTFAEQASKILAEKEQTEIYAKKRETKEANKKVNNPLELVLK